MCAAFGRILREERVRQQLSLTQLAQIAGVARSAVGDAEAGKGAGPEMDWGNRVADALGFPYDVLVKRARVSLEAAEAQAKRTP